MDYLKPAFPRPPHRQPARIESTSIAAAPAARLAAVLGRRWQLVVMALALQLPIVTFVVTALASGSAQVGAVSAIAVASSAVLMAAYFGARPFDWFSPLSGVLLSVLCGTSLRALYLAFSESEQAKYVLHGDQITDFMSGAVIVLMASVAIAAGYFAARHWKWDLANLLVQRRPWSRPRLVLLSCVVAGVAVVCAADILRTTGATFESLTDFSGKRFVAVTGGQPIAALGYHRWGAEVLPAFALYVWLAGTMRPGFRRSIPAMVLLFALAMVSPLMASSRMQICFVVINLLLILYYLGKLTLRRVVVSTVFLLFSFSALLLVREAGQAQKDVDRQLTPLVILDTIVGNENFTDIGRVKRVYEGVPERMPYKYGETFFSWITAPVPRVWWENKPVVSHDFEITEFLYGGRPHEHGIEGGGRPPGLISELIMNFGVLAVPIGMFVFGAALRLLFNSFQPFLRSSPLALVAYAALFLPCGLMLMGGEFSRTVIESLVGLITVGVFAALITPGVMTRLARTVVP